MTRFLLLFTLLLSLPLTSFAAVLVVNSDLDNTIAGNSAVTLREAIIAAETDSSTDLGDTGSGIDVIDLTGLSGDIDLGAALPLIESTIVIIGPGDAELSITGGGTDGIFFINGGELSLSGVSVNGGNSTGGRGGDANVDGAGGGGAGLGGAIMINQGQANLFRSSFSDNLSFGGRGGNTLGSGATSFGGTGGGGFSGNGGDDTGGGISFGSGGGDGGPFGNPGGAGGTVNGNNGGDGMDGSGGGGGGSTAATRGGTGGFAAGGGGAGSSPFGAGPAGAGGFGGGGGGGTVDSAANGVVATGATGGAFAGSGGNGTLSGFGGAGGGGAGLGGAVFVRDGASLTAWDTEFTGNGAFSGDEGLAFAAGGADGNEGQGKGGALFISDAATSVTGMLTFSGNTATNANSSPDDNNDRYGMTQQGQFIWLEFTLDEILVSENSGIIQVPMLVTTSDGAATESVVDLTVQSRDIDTSAGLDYSVVVESVSIPMGTSDGTVQSIPVTILTDMDSETDELFRLEVSSVSEALLSSRFSQQIRILDGASPDVRVSKTAGSALVAPGAILDYTIVLTNEGNVDIDNVHVEDSLPATLLNASWTCVAGFNASCSASGSGDIDDMASLPSGSMVTYLLTATVSPTATQDIINTVTATLPFALVDATPADNTATEITTIDILFADGFESVLRVDVTGSKSYRYQPGESVVGSSPVTIMLLEDTDHASVHHIQRVDLQGRRLIRLVTVTGDGIVISDWATVPDNGVTIEF